MNKIYQKHYLVKPIKYFLENAIIDYMCYWMNQRG